MDKLRWMQQERIWPNGLRYLWTDYAGDEYDQAAITTSWAAARISRAA